MFKNIENLKIKDIYKGVAQNHYSVSSRKSNAFVFRTAGTSRYAFSDFHIDLHTGEIIFLPAGCSYNCTALSDIPCEYIVIRFDAELTGALPCSYSFDNFQDIDEVKNNLVDLWKLGDQYEHYRCYSIFYNLLAYIKNLENQTYADKKSFYIISPAVSYLKKHIYDCNLKMETLHTLCGISGTYFRKIFESQYDVSPQKYILGKRLSRAKTLIDNGHFESISEVATTVGYNDPLYFSRAFKKKYGVSPSQYAKN